MYNVILIPRSIEKNCVFPRFEFQQNSKQLFHGYIYKTRELLFSSSPTL